MGRNATQEAQTLAEHCERTLRFKPLAIMNGTIAGHYLSRGLERWPTLARFIASARNNVNIDRSLHAAATTAGQKAVGKTRPGFVMHATLGWCVGDVISELGLASRERQDEKLISLRACHPRDTVNMTWDATSLWNGKMATGPDSLGFCHWERFIGWYMYMGIPP